MHTISPLGRISISLPLGTIDPLHYFNVSWIWPGCLGSFSLPLTSWILVQLLWVMISIFLLPTRSQHQQGSIQWLHQLRTHPILSGQQHSISSFCYGGSQTWSMQDPQCWCDTIQQLSQELVLCSVANNVRSIPPIMDDLKPGRCKILNINEITYNRFINWGLILCSIVTMFNLFLLLWMASDLVNAGSFSAVLRYDRH